MRPLPGVYVQQVPAATIVVPDGLIGYWPTNDGSGTTVTAAIGTNATMSGAIGWVAGPKGVAGTAIEVTADGGIATVPTADAPKPTTAISICFWFYRTGIKQYSAPLIMPHPTDSPPYASYGFNDTTTSTNNSIIMNVNGNLVFGESVECTSSGWDFWTSTWVSGAPAILYKNAVSSATTSTLTGTISYYSAPLCFCRNSVYNDRWSRGRVSSIRIYDRALPQTDIQAIYDSEKT